ncbi:hypothetical protein CAUPRSCDRAFT_10650, partial [Caulochytrium protostelioides]
MAAAAPAAAAEAVAAIPAAIPVLATPPPGRRDLPASKPTDHRCPRGHRGAARPGRRDGRRAAGPPARRAAAAARVRGERLEHSLRSRRRGGRGAHAAPRAHGPPHRSGDEPELPVVGRAGASVPSRVARRRHGQWQRQQQQQQQQQPGGPSRRDHPGSPCARLAAHRPRRCAVLVDGGWRTGDAVVHQEPFHDRLWRQRREPRRRRRGREPDAGRAVSRQTCGESCHAARPTPSDPAGAGAVGRRGAVGVLVVVVVGAPHTSQPQHGAAGDRAPEPDVVRVRGRRAERGGERGGPRRPAEPAAGGRGAGAGAGRRRPAVGASHAAAGAARGQPPPQHAARDGGGHGAVGRGAGPGARGARTGAGAVAVAVAGRGDAVAGGEHGRVPRAQQAAAGVDDDRAPHVCGERTGRGGGVGLGRGGDDAAGGAGGRANEPQRAVDADAGAALGSERAAGCRPRDRQGLPERVASSPPSPPSSSLPATLHAPPAGPDPGPPAGPPAGPDPASVAPTASTARETLVTPLLPAAATAATAAPDPAHVRIAVAAISSSSSSSSSSPSSPAAWPSPAAVAVSATADLTMAMAVDRAMTAPRSPAAVSAAPGPPSAPSAPPPPPNLSTVSTAPTEHDHPKPPLPAAPSLTAAIDVTTPSAPATTAATPAVAAAVAASPSASWPPSSGPIPLADPVRTASRKSAAPPPPPSPPAKGPRKAYPNLTLQALAASLMDKYRQTVPQLRNRERRARSQRQPYAKLLAHTAAERAYGGRRGPSPATARLRDALGGSGIDSASVHSDSNAEDGDDDNHSEAGGGPAASAHGSTAGGAAYGHGTANPTSQQILEAQYASQIDAQLKQLPDAVYEVLYANEDALSLAKAEFSAHRAAVAALVEDYYQLRELLLAEEEQAIRGGTHPQLRADLEAVAQRKRRQRARLADERDLQLEVVAHQHAMTERLTTQTCIKAREQIRTDLTARIQMLLIQLEYENAHYWTFVDHAPAYLTSAFQTAPETVDRDVQARLLQDRADPDGIAHHRGAVAPCIEAKAKERQRHGFEPVPIPTYLLPLSDADQCADLALARMLAPPPPPPPPSMPPSMSLTPSMPSIYGNGDGDGEDDGGGNGLRAHHGMTVFMDPDTRMAESVDMRAGADASAPFGSLAPAAAYGPPPPYAASSLAFAARSGYGQINGHGPGVFAGPLGGVP